MGYLESIPLGTAVVTVVGTSGAKIGPGLPHPSALCVHTSGAFMALADIARLLGADQAATCLRHHGVSWMGGEHDAAAGRLLSGPASSADIVASLLDVQWSIAAAVLCVGADHQAVTGAHIAQRLSGITPEGKLIPASQWSLPADYVAHMPHMQQRRAA